MAIGVIRLGSAAVWSYRRCRDVPGLAMHTMLKALRYGVTVLLVLMHALIGHAAGSAVCLGGGSCHRAEVVHLGIGHTHDHADHHAHSRGHHHHHGGSADEAGKRRGDAVVAGERDAGAVACDAGCGAPGGACVDGWIPHGRAGGDPRGDDVAPVSMALVFEPVPMVVGGAVRLSVEPARDQWPPGVDPGIRCTVLVI